MKIFTVKFNDGGWHERLPEYTIVAESKEKAIEKVLEEHTYYKSWDSWAVEFKIEGYIIEVYDEKSYNREKSIGKLIN